VIDVTERRRPSLLTFPGLLLTGLLALPAPAQLCGDCNLDLQVTVVDALTAARYSVGLISLTGPQLFSCNVDGQGLVDIVDALLIAQCSVGVLGSPCGLACNGLRVVGVSPPAGVSSGDVLIGYTIVDDNPPPPPAQPVDVTVTFSTDQGSSFQIAAMGAGGDPVTGLTGSAAGTTYSFSWDSVADGLGAGCEQLAIVRIAPIDASGPGLAGGSANFRVDNSVDQFTSGPDVPGGLLVQEHLQLLLHDGRVLLCGGTSGGSPTALAFLYDPLAGTLVQIADMTSPRVGHAGVALPGATAWVAGGASALTPAEVLEGSVEYCDATSGTWTPAPAVPLPTDTFGLAIRVAGASAVYFDARDEILLVGGVYDDGAGGLVVANSAVRYVPDPGNPAAAVADFYPSPVLARYQQTLTLLAGPDGSLGTLDDLALLYGGSGQDPAAPPTAPLPGQTAIHSFHALGDAELFVNDPGTGAWQWHEVVDNRYYLDQQQLDPASSVLGPRREHAAVRLDDDSVLLIGGHAEVDEDPVTLAPLLVPADDRLRYAERCFVDYTTPSLSQVDPAGLTGYMRVGPSATRLGCGTVLVAGGYDYVAVAQPVIGPTEIYDPAKPAGSRWRGSAPLLTARWLHGATRLPDGQVLITGGESGTSPAPMPLGSTELYRP
jgi:hypothetical protein